MKDKDKTDKFIKLSTVVSILLVGIAVFYYLVIFLPDKAKQEENNKNLENRLKTTKQIDDRNQEIQKQKIYSDCSSANSTNNYPFENYQKDIVRDSTNADYYKKLYEDSYNQCLRNHGINP